MTTGLTSLRQLLVLMHHDDVGTRLCIICCCMASSPCLGAGDEPELETLTCWWCVARVHLSSAARRHGCCCTRTSRIERERGEREREREREILHDSAIESMSSLQRTQLSWLTPCSNESDVVVDIKSLGSKEALRTTGIVSLGHKHQFCSTPCKHTADQSRQRFGHSATSAVRDGSIETWYGLRKLDVATKLAASIVVNGVANV